MTTKAGRAMTAAEIHAEQLNIFTPTERHLAHYMAAKLDAHDNTRTTPHGFADLVCIATCECGATFEGDHEAEVLALWGEHCEACEAEQ
jgi:hypothetical protein